MRGAAQPEGGRDQALKSEMGSKRLSGSPPFCKHLICLANVLPAGIASQINKLSLAGKAGHHAGQHLGNVRIWQPSWANKRRARRPDGALSHDLRGASLCHRAA
jgi:hypothetical protein